MPNRMLGLLVSFEGTEGCGKSTLIQHVFTRLQSFGCTVVKTREPGGSELAEKIRDILLTQDMNSRTELFLYEAARAQHWVSTIEPALRQGAIVLCDRFTDSTLAYQSFARGLPWKEVKLLNRMATSGRKPDLTLLLDIDPKIGLARAKDPNRFEAEGLDFQKKVRQGFLKSRTEDPNRWHTLKVHNKSPEVLCESVVRYLKRRFKRHFKGIQSE